MSAEKPASLKVVLDTNVYFSAFSNRGVPYQLWQRALHGDYRLFISPPLMRELADVLRNDLTWSEVEIVAQLKLLSRVASIVIPTETLNVVVNDPDDDRILECAVAGNADLIVSGDQHLTKLKSYRGIGIVRPVDFLRTLG
jgi:putative PIN family toxin of toxin-antitoxin system